MTFGLGPRPEWLPEDYEFIATADDWQQARHIETGKLFFVGSGILWPVRFATEEDMERAGFKLGERFMDAENPVNIATDFKT